MKDEDLFRPLSAKVGRTTYSTSGRPMSQTTARMAETKRLQSILKAKAARAGRTTPEKP